MGSTTVRVQQGSQPSFDGVDVGVQRVGEHRGERKARLLIRGREQRKKVDLAEGQSEDLFGTGLLTLAEVHLNDGARAEVTFAFEAADA
jgi:hypothetical protein